MYTKKVTQLLLFFIITTATSAQQFYLESGKTLSSFDYKDSQNVGLDNLQATTHSSMAIGYRSKFISEKLKGSIGVGYSGYGAIGSDAVLEGVLEWDINYFELGVGLEYNVFKIHDLEFFLKGIATTGFLIQGTQSLNDEIINLKNNDDFNNAMISYKVGAGFLYPVSKELSFYIQYLFGKSLNQADDGDNESLRIKTHNIGFGVLINLSNKS